ncbi:hypothetical protein TSUD_66040, partial [Trifolium subterraneum]
MAFSLRTKTFTFIEGDEDPIQLWNEINDSDQWHKGVYHTLCAAYAIVSFIALVQLVRIQMRVPEYGWTTQKALEQVLMEVPGLLFFSTYTLLVLFWAEIYHQARSEPAQKLRPAYFSINGVVYLIQICLWIYMTASKTAAGYQVAKLFLAVISFCAALGFLLYGG